MKKPSCIWHPFTQHAIAPDSIHIDRAEGAYLIASNKEGGDKKQIIDAISSWWVITHGHCHPKISKAVKEQATKLDQVIFAGFTHDPAEELAERLVKITNDELEHVFYSDSGSTAVEVALKMAIGYWQHTNRPRRKIIALENGYHGDTFGTMSAGGRSIYNKIYEPYLFNVEHIPVPTKGNEAQSLAALEQALKNNADNVAAFIFEPLIQGAGGMIMYSAETLRAMADLCKAHNVLLIADEVMTGFGRTGTLFGCDQANFTPDILCLSKGLTGGFLPLGTTLCTHEIYNAFYHKDKAKMFFHSSSFTGNPMACTAANASLKIWETEPVRERIQNIEQSHAHATIRLSKNKNITNIRQKGTILAMDINAKDTGYLSSIQPKLYEYALSQGVLLRPLGNTIYILPPYCVNKTDLEKIYTVISDMIEHAINTPQKNLHIF